MANPQQRLNNATNQLAQMPATMSSQHSDASDEPEDEDEDWSKDVGPAPILRPSRERRGVAPEADLDGAEILRLRGALLQEVELRKEEEAKRRAEMERFREEREARRKAEAERMRQRMAQQEADMEAEDAMATQLAQGILLSIQTGQMTASQASMMLGQAMLTEGQKAKVREILASYGISLAK